MQTATQDNLTRAEAAERARLVSQPVYEVALDLTTGDESFGSRTSVRFCCSEPGASTFVDLTGATVQRMVLNGRELAADAFDGHRIHLTDLQEANELDVTAVCVYRRTGSGFHFFRDPVDGQPYLHTSFEPFEAHAVYACFDQPDIKGRFSFTVDTPEGWEVCSNMAPSARPGAGGGRWAFPQTPVMPTYITCFVAGPFHVIHDRHRSIDLGIWCRRSLAPHVDPDEIFAITKAGFDFFEEVFDYPYPFGKYDQLFVPEFKFGAMENAGCVTFLETYIFRSRVTDAQRQSRAGTILHEMAHMWFGNLVTMQWWDDLWLNESFATYMGNLAVQRATRFTDIWAGFASGTKGWAYTQDQLPTTHPIVADIDDIHATHLNFDGITYAKGASVLKLFVAWAGEECFLEGVRRYFKRHEWGNTTLGDFMAPIEETSGRDLGAWSKEWLQTAGVNTLRVDAPVAGDVYESVAVVQSAPEQHPVLRSHRVAVGLYDLVGDELHRRTRVELDVTGERTDVPELAGERVADLLLPNDDDLTYAKVRLDDRSLATLVKHLAALSDPVARSLGWSTAWDMVRDGEMRARDFVELVCNNLDESTDMAVVTTQMLRLGLALGYYVDPAARDEVRGRVAEAARGRLLSFTPGGDHQVAWARIFFSAARAPADVAFVKALLDGSKQVDGLSVDTDTRWSIVSSLARAGEADTELIASEMQRDPTDLGRRHSDAARAAMPTPEAKQAAWESITSDPERSLTDVKELLLGFADPTQPELLEPFADRYFEQLLPYFGRRGIDFGFVFCENAFPKWLVRQDTIDRVESFMSEQNVPPPVRRLLIENADTVRRAMKARATDAGSRP